MYSRIRFRKRGNPPTDFTIREDELGDLGDGKRLAVKRATEQELSRQVNIAYMDFDADYAQGTQYTRRLTGVALNERTIEIPVVTSADHARKISEIALYLEWLARQTYEFSTGPAWQHIEPTDCGVVLCAGRAHVLRITRKTESPDGTVRFEAAAEDTTMYAAPAAPGVALPDYRQVIATTPAATSVRPVLVELPAIAAAGTTAAVAWYPTVGVGDTFAGAQLFRSTDGGATFEPVEATTAPATYGTAQTVLADSSALGHVVDTASDVTVRLTSGALRSVTRSELKGLQQLALIGDEVIAFQTVETVAGGVRLTNMIRGLYGTEPAMPAHAAGERFVLLNAAVRDLDAPTGQPVQYKLVPRGGSLTSAPAITFTAEGDALRTLSPVHIGGGVDGSGDILLDWTRRDRAPGTLTSGQDTPLSDAPERYDVEVWDVSFATLRRTMVGLTASAATYSAADQITDFGAAPDSIGVRVYQLSTAGVRGDPGQAVVTVR